jgi:hypothetical protein
MVSDCGPKFCKDYFLLLHRVMTALRASRDLALAERFFMRAGPPLRPPSLPSATAAGFFRLFVLLDRLGMRHFWMK